MGFEGRKGRFEGERMYPRNHLEESLQESRLSGVEGEQETTVMMRGGQVHSQDVVSVTEGQAGVSTDCSFRFKW